MHELEAAERYAIAALFTLALHSVTASSERYARDDWGEDDELYRHSEVGEGSVAKAFVIRESVSERSVPEDSNSPDRLTSVIESNLFVTRALFS